MQVGVPVDGTGELFSSPHSLLITELAMLRTQKNRVKRLYPPSTIRTPILTPDFAGANTVLFKVGGFVKCAIANCFNVGNTFCRFKMEQMLMDFILGLVIGAISASLMCFFVCVVLRLGLVATGKSIHLKDIKTIRHFASLIWSVVFCTICFLIAIVLFCLPFDVSEFLNIERNSSIQRGNILGASAAYWLFLPVFFRWIESFELSNLIKRIKDMDMNKWKIATAILGVVLFSFAYIAAPIFLYEYKMSDCIGDYAGKDDRYRCSMILNGAVRR